MKPEVDGILLVPRQLRAEEVDQLRLRWEAQWRGPGREIILRRGRIREFLRRLRARLRRSE